MISVVSLHDHHCIDDYIKCGITTFVLGCEYSLYHSSRMSLTDIKSLVESHKELTFFVAMNALYDQHYMNDIKMFIKELSLIHVHGMIFQDFGILNIVDDCNYDFEMIYHPETLNTNGATLNVLSEFGVDAACLSRVIPLVEQIDIVKTSRIPLMIQIAGVEFVAASKRHLLSNYRDASQLDFEIENNHKLTIQARGSQLRFQIIEDRFGTVVHTSTRLNMIDVLDQLTDFKYTFIETMFNDQEEIKQTLSVYQQALEALENHTYDTQKEHLLKTLEAMPYEYDRGFMFDQTVYKLEDVRKMENENNQ